MHTTEVRGVKFRGERLYLVRAEADDGQADEIIVAADREGLAQTRLMAVTAMQLSGQLVEYRIVEIPRFQQYVVTAQDADGEHQTFYLNLASGLAGDIMTAAREQAGPNGTMLIEGRNRLNDYVGSPRWSDPVPIWQGW